MIVLGSQTTTSVAGAYSFGWKHSTHKLITEKLVRQVNMTLPKKCQLNYEILKYSCVEPDYSRKNITKYINGHFADIDNPSIDPPDARELAKFYTEKAISAHFNNLEQKRDDYLGYALHFIQDMLAPVHTEFKSAPKGHPIREEHKNFEIIATREQQQIINKPVQWESSNGKDFFTDILPNSMRTAKIQLLKLRNGDDINLVAQDALKNTYITTGKYLDFFVSKISKNKNSATKNNKELLFN